MDDEKLLFDRDMAVVTSAQDQNTEILKDNFRAIPPDDLDRFVATLQDQLHDLTKRREQGETDMNFQYHLWVVEHAHFGLTYITLKVHEDREKAKENDNPDPSH